MIFYQLWYALIITIAMVLVVPFLASSYGPVVTYPLLGFLLVRSIMYRLYVLRFLVQAYKKVKAEGLTIEI